MNEIKRKCKDDLKAYLGLPPYVGHASNGSGVYYYWLIRKYGTDLIRECQEELIDEESKL